MISIDKEKEVVSAMISLYCKGRHKPSAPGLCRACRGLESYAHSRLDTCPYGDDKSFCSACPHHCYQPLERALIRRVMAYAGRKMIFYRPGMALKHVGISLKGRLLKTCKR